MEAFICTNIWYNQEEHERWGELGMEIMWGGGAGKGGREKCKTEHGMEWMNKSDL